MSVLSAVEALAIDDEAGAVDEGLWCCGLTLHITLSFLLYFVLCSCFVMLMYYIIIVVESVAIPVRIVY